MFNPFRGLKPIYLVLFASFDLHMFAIAIPGNF